MTKQFPLAARTANEMTYAERDERYRALHRLPESGFAHASGLHMIWKYRDVKEVLTATTPGISNANALDPLVGFPRIATNPRALPHLVRDLIPLPAAATANCGDAAMHKRVWDTMAGPDGYFTIPAHARAARLDELSEHFRAAMREVGTGAQLDVTAISVAYAARVTGSAVGIPMELWPQIQSWSGAQSGLLGRRMHGRELADAVAGLGRLFAVSKRSVAAVRTAEGAPNFAGQLRECGIPDRVAVAAMANSLAAGVHTISGTIQQGVQRMLADPERTWWKMLADPQQSTRVAAKILQLDPGLVAWKRRAERPVVLAGGTTLPKGPILVLFAAANRDPDAFGDPLEFGGGGKMPLTFGFGAHICPGRQLATAAVEVFLARLAELTPAARQLPATYTVRRPDLLFSGADVTISR